MDKLLILKYLVDESVSMTSFKMYPIRDGSNVYESARFLSLDHKTNERKICANMTFDNKLTLIFYKIWINN